MQKRGEKNKLIWKRKHNCSVCRQPVYFDDEKDIMACGCGQFTTKGLIKEMKEHLLKTKFKKTHSIKLVFHGFEPCELVG